MNVDQIETEEINLLLAISATTEDSLILNTVKSLGVKQIKIVYTWQEITNELSNQTYDVIISRTKLHELDIVNKVQENAFFKKHKIPVIFILKNNLIKSQMSLLGNLMTKFLFEKTLSKELLDYAIKDIYFKNKLDVLRRENQLRYKNLFEHSYDINVIVDLEYNILEGNKQFHKQIETKLPYSLSKLFIYTSTFNRFNELLILTEDIRRFNAEILLYNEPAYCLLDTFKLYNEDSDHVGYHIIIKDIDSEFRAQKLATRANNLMTTGKFMRSLAHEIRNPLTNIQLAMEQLREDLTASENSELFFNIMKRSSGRITELLSKLMNAYKSSEVILKSENLEDIVNKSIFLAQDRLSLKNVELNIDYKFSPVTVQADFDKLATAILNLLVNAIEAMDKDNKKINVTIEYSKKGNIMLCIEDNAKGMNQEQLNALFNPFYTGKSKGIGLGLTTTQNLILAHNWSIDVESKVGKGTKFIISIQ